MLQCYKLNIKKFGVKKLLKHLFKNKKKIFLIKFLVIIGFLVFIDQYIKNLIVNGLKLEKSFILIPNMVKITHIRNYGAAFSIFFKKTNILIFFTILVITIFIYYLIKEKNIHSKNIVPSIMIISGGIGNLLDRIKNGYVIDYVKLIFWPFENFAIFNFADCLVVVGSLLFLLNFVKKEIIKK